MSKPLPDLKYLAVQGPRKDITIQTNFPVGDAQLVEWPIRSADCLNLLQEAILVVDYVLLRLEDAGPFMLSMSSLSMTKLVVLDDDYDLKYKVGMSIQQVCDFLVSNGGCFDNVTFILTSQDEQYLSHEEMLAEGIDRIDDARMTYRSERTKADVDDVVTVRYRDQQGAVRKLTVGTF